ncbi:MAG: dephospho-CoA kinase [Aeromicrobium sp.]|nr:MAG: dephospho-CoA kinase [Aeromicrobium sp.]
MNPDVLSPASIAHFLTLQPSCGSTTIIGIDGRSGTGKTTLGRQLAFALECPLVSLESVYQGWEGLDAGIDQMADALAALAHGDAAFVTTWDWAAGKPGERLPLPTSHLLVLEGVGTGAHQIRPFLSYLIWLEAPAALRQTRALSRGGENYEQWWYIWAAQEDSYIERDTPAKHADLLIETTRTRDT